MYRLASRGLAPVLAALLIVGVAGARPLAGPSEQPIRTWVPNGPVNAVVRSGSTMYLGGSFTVLSPRSGRGAVFDASTLARRQWPEIGGMVPASVGDGAGGFYLAEATGIEAPTRLVHRLADGTLDPAFSTVAVDGYVLVLARSGERLYFAGLFTAVGGKPRDNAAAVETSSGALLPWAPGTTAPERAVIALAVSGSTVFLGGAASDTASPAYLAAFDAGSARPRWRARVTVEACVCLTEYLAYVSALRVVGRTLYVGGYFDAVRGRRRSSVAALDVRTGAVRPWRPTLGTPGEGSPAVWALEADGTRIYLGGPGLLVATDRASGRLRWRVRLDDDVWSLVRLGSRLLVGGYRAGTSFDAATVAKSWGGLLAAVQTTTGRRLAWSPLPNGSVYTVAASGTSIFAGGAFTGFGGVARANLAAIDVTTGLPTPWDPGVGNHVSALGLAGDTVYVTGIFDGRFRAFDATSGERVSQPAYAEAFGTGFTKMLAWDDRIAVASDDLYVIDRRSGAVTKYPCNGAMSDLAMDGTTLYVAGGFTEIAGLHRTGLAAIDIAKGGVTSWDPKLPGRFGSVAATADRIFVGRDENSAFPPETRDRAEVVALSARDGAALWRTLAGVPPEILLDPDNHLYLVPRIADLGVAGKSVYVVGTFDRMGGAARTNAAALSVEDGQVLPWNPRLSPLTAGGAFDAGASRIDLTSDEITVVGAFTDVGSISQSRLARFRVAG